MRLLNSLNSADPDVGQPYRRAYGRTQIVPYGRSRGGHGTVKPATLATIFARAVTVERLRSAATLGTVHLGTLPGSGPAPRGRQGWPLPTRIVLSYLTNLAHRRGHIAVRLEAGSPVACQRRQLVWGLYKRPVVVTPAGHSSQPESAVLSRNVSAVGILEQSHSRRTPNRAYSWVPVGPGHGRCISHYSGVAMVSPRRCFRGIRAGALMSGSVVVAQQRP
jgi:hypothetical protein